MPMSARSPPAHARACGGMTAAATASLIGNFHLLGIMGARQCRPLETGP